MNLLKEQWLKAVVDGQPHTIGVADISQANVMGLAFPRLDFNGAVMQFLIGLIQTRFAPASMKQWQQYYRSPPTAAELEQAFADDADYFALLASEGPRFMQDFSLLASEGEQKDVAGLLIEAPGGKTIKDNTDHFIKRGLAEQMCPSCLAAALYCLQCSAPSGGVGHRTSLRGGGGLTTLLLPAKSASLWHTLWLNILPLDHGLFATEFNEPADCYPWLAATRTSEKKGTEILPDQVNPLQMFWAMPRRIRVKVDEPHSGACGVCGDHSEVNVRHYVTKNYGPNYGDGWTHSLTPYRHDPKHKSPPLSIKGKQGGLSYKDWLGLAIGKTASGEQPAIVVQHFIEHKQRRLVADNKDYLLWCYAYDMDNMKARCWYEHTLPMIILPETVDREGFMGYLSQYLELAKETASLLRSGVKEAWANRPKDLKGDVSVIDVGFWQATEAPFFLLVKQLTAGFGDQTKQNAVDQHWLNTLKSQLFGQFDQRTLDRFGGDKELKRIMKARQKLTKLFHSAKIYQLIQQRSTTATKEKK